MALISVYKVVSSVPESLESNALYLVRTGTGFDLYVSDLTGSVAYQINSSSAGLSNIIEDTTPQLGGDLDLSGNDITGTGNISIAGDIEANIHIGSLRGEIQFKAKAGEALTKGDPVYISSYDTVGNTPIVAIADANDSSKMPCFGLANESVSLNASVDVVTFGTLSGLDTSGFSLGDTLYISNTGTLTNSKPAGESSLIQNIGKVQRVDNSAGAIKVGGAGRTNDVPNLNQGNVFIGNASNQAEKRGLTLDDIAETEIKKHFTANDETKLNGIEAGATADQTKAEIEALNNNADQLDGLEASQFLRSDASGTIDVGRGIVFIENNANDNQNGAGLTFRTSSNPSSGEEGSAGSIFTIRSSGGVARLWIGQSITTTGDNDFVTNNATFNGNITLDTSQHYYISNNANIFHGTTTATVAPTATDTAYYAIFDSVPVTNTDIYSYTEPTSSTNTGIKLLLTGKYKVSYTLNWKNNGYTGRCNLFSSLAKHSSAITPTETELAGSRSFAYARHSNYASFATTTNVTVIDVNANEFIKCKTLVAKDDRSFDDNFTGLQYVMSSSIVIEYLGIINELEPK